MKKILLLVVTVGLVALAATPAIGGGPGAPKFVTGTEVGTTTVTPVGGPYFYSDSVGVMTAKKPWGKLSYRRQAIQDWSGATWPSNPCATLPQTVMEYTDVNDSTSTITTTFTGTTCELPVADSNPPLYNNTRYQTTLVETVLTGTGRFTGVTGTLNVTGISTATATPGLYTDAFKTTGTLSFAP